MKRKMAIFDVYVWSAKRVTEQYPEKLRSIISTDLDSIEVKYSPTNEREVTQKNRPSNHEILYQQMQRYRAAME